MDEKLKLMERRLGEINTKVLAMVDSIKEECRKRGFTLNEFEQLANILLYDARERRDEIYESSKF